MLFLLFLLLQSLGGGGVQLRLWDPLAAAMATERRGGTEQPTVALCRRRHQDTAAGYEHQQLW